MTPSPNESLNLTARPASSLPASELYGEVACTAELMIQLSETERAIAVGERFTPWVRLYSCGGRERVSDTFTWRAEDPTVVAVDAVRGTVTGLAPGRTVVTVRGAQHHELGTLLVSVRARGR